MSTSPYHAFALLLVCVVPLLASPALGEQRRAPGAEELLEAVELIREGRCDAAIPLLRRAHDLGGLRNALWNLAECYASMGRPTPAIEAYRQYMGHPRTGAADRAEAEAAVQRLEESLSRLTVTCPVEGARVLADGLEAGTTPAVVTVGPGRHVLEVTSPGFTTWRLELETGPGESHALAADIETLPGVLVVTSAPSTAELRVDGRDQGSTPRRVTVPSGTHLVEVRLPGHRADQRQVQVARGQEVALAVELERTEGVLAVGTNASGAQILVDGEDPGESPLPPLHLVPGRYHLDVSAPRHRPWSGDVEVEDGRTTVVDVSLFSLRGIHQGWFWGLLATTVATLGTSLAMFWASSADVAAFDAIASRIAVGAFAGDRPSELRAQALAHRDAALPYQTAGSWLLGVGGLSLVATVVVGLLTRFREGSSHALSTFTDEAPAAPDEETAQ